MNANLSYMMSRVSAVSTQTFKLTPQNSTSASPGQQVRISLPSNTLLNLRSLKLMFAANTEASSNEGSRLPAKIASLVDRVVLEAGGVTIDGGSLNEYSTLLHAKHALEGDSCGPMSHPQIVRAKSYHSDANAMAQGNPEQYADNFDFVMPFDLGFLGSCEPSIIDTSLLPDLTVVIHLHSRDVISSSSNVALDSFKTAATSKNTNYNLSSIRLICECIGLGSGVYDQLVSRAISERGMVELPFKQYTSTLDNHSGVTRFHVSTQSLDRIWAIFRPDTYNDRGACVLVKGHKENGFAISGTDIGKPTYDLGGTYGLNNNSEKFIHKYHNFSGFSSRAGATLQFQLNGSLTPAFPGKPCEWLGMSMDSVEKNGYDIPVKTFDQYLNNYSVICHRLCLPGSSTREVAGLDSRGINLQCSLNSTGLASDTNVVVFCECTSTLQIGPNKQFSVVQ